jgi:hypothetical protein
MRILGSPQIEYFGALAVKRTVNVCLRRRAIEPSERLTGGRSWKAIL